MNVRLVDADIAPAPGAKPILRGVNLEAIPGDYVCIIGPNGSGKTSLAKTLALIIRPVRGKLFLNGWDASSASDTERARARLRFIGYIPQKESLIPQLTVLENIMLPLIQLGIPKKEARRIVVEWAHKLDIADLLYRKPAELSGGQRRLALIARALVKDPPIIIADEPETGLDSSHRELVTKIFKEYNSQGAIIIHLSPTPFNTTNCSKKINIETYKN